MSVNTISATLTEGTNVVVDGDQHWTCWTVASDEIIDGEVLLYCDAFDQYRAVSVDRVTVA